MGFAHQTYAEFLAAYYLICHETTVGQIMSLLTHPSDPEKKLIPQLYETTAWLAGMNADVFREVIKTEPEILVKSVGATTPGEDKAELVRKLITRLEEGMFSRHDWDWKNIKRLSYPGLADQIKPYINDTGKPNSVRQFAINIAEECKLQSLQDDLVGIALDVSQSVEVRGSAASCLVRVGDESSKAKLKPLAEGKAGSDPSDQLKAYGLRAVWPDHMTGKELFANLTTPKRENFLGAYKWFVSDAVIPNLKTDHLTAALKWVEKQKRDPDFPITFKKLSDEILLKAWQHLEYPGILEAFAKAIHSRLDDYIGFEKEVHSQFLNEFETHVNKRRKVIEAIIPFYSSAPEDSVSLLGSTLRLALNNDIPWMMQKLQAATSEEDQKVYAHLILRLFDRNNREQFESILLACQDNQILRDAFAPLTQPVELNSREAEQIKDHYYRFKNWERMDRQRPLLDPPPTERVSLLLNDFESGDISAWWRLCMEMTLEPDSTHYGDELESDLTLLPVWKKATLETKARLVNAAKKYVLESDAYTQDWLGRNTPHRPAFAGYKALRLLMSEDIDFIKTLQPEVWKKWAPIILAYPASSTDEDRKPQKLLTTIAHLCAPEEIAGTLAVLIDKEDIPGTETHIISKVEDCWDGHIEKVLLEKLKNPELKPNSLGCLLIPLVEHGVKEARIFAKSLVKSPPFKNEDEKARAKTAACVLITRTEDAGWQKVWPVIQSDVEFGREVVLSLGHEYEYRGKAYKNLTIGQLSDFYIWLVRQFPYSDDPHHEGGAHWVGPREQVVHLRDGILDSIRNQGSFEACQAIQKIKDQFPELKWLNNVLSNAKIAARRKTWTSPQPEYVLRIAANNDSRLVESGSQLLEVIIESLGRLQAKLHGETPAANFLWDKSDGNKWQPKDENSLSDFVKLHLEDDIGNRGIVVGREVQIRRGVGAGTGQNTDIHVDAVTDDGKVSVIIETKGCWHRELFEAMETQLADRYLKDNPYRHGLYLVGWFNCDQWDKGDYRKKNAPKISSEEAQEKLDSQATDLSKNGKQIQAVILDTALR